MQNKVSLLLIFARINQKFRKKTKKNSRPAQSETLRLNRSVRSPRPERSGPTDGRYRLHFCHRELKFTIETISDLCWSISSLNVTVRDGKVYHKFWLWFQRRPKIFCNLRRTLVREKKKQGSFIVFTFVKLFIHVLGHSF